MKGGEKNMNDNKGKTQFDDDMQNDTRQQSTDDQTMSEEVKRKGGRASDEVTDMQMEEEEDVNIDQ